MILLGFAGYRASRKAAFDRGLIRLLTAPRRLRSKLRARLTSFRGRSRKTELPGRFRPKTESLLRNCTIRPSFCRLIRPDNRRVSSRSRCRALGAFHTEFFNLGLSEVLNSYERVLRGAGANQLIKFCLNGRAIAVLGILN